MIERSPEEALRDRAILIVRLATASGVVGALGLTWMFSNMAEAYFSGRAPAPAAAPKIPVAETPVQKPRDAVTTVVHHRGYAPGYTAPRPPASAPGAAPAPPPPPACVSTPSRPC